MKIGLDTFSFHIVLAAGRYDVFRALDWMAEVGFAGVQININGPAGRFLGRDPADTAHMKRVRQALEKKGFFAEIGGGHATDPILGEAQLRLAANLGADTLRMVVGLDGTMAHTLRQLRTAMDRLGPLARHLGVRLAIENHEDITSAELHQVLVDLNDPWIGACLDTGNDLVVYGDPLEAARLLAPLAVTTHLKDQQLVRVGNKIYSVGVPLGTGDIDLPAILHEIRSRSRLERVLIQNCTGYAAPLNRFGRTDLSPRQDYAGIPTWVEESALRQSGRLLSLEGLGQPELAALATKQLQDIEKDFAWVKHLLPSTG